jgi:hypothetical protein
MLAVLLVLGDVRSFAHSEDHDVHHISGPFALFQGREGSVVLIYSISVHSGPVIVW